MEQPADFAPSISHLAIWSRDIEALRAFYSRHFGAAAGPRYENKTKRFTSYFLSFARGPRLELMQVPDLQDPVQGRAVGLAHFAVSVGSEDRVVQFTNKLRAAGVTVTSEPRRTGDGYFESVVLDPDGNAIEITV